MDMIHVTKRTQILVALIILSTAAFARQLAEAKFPEEDHIFSSGTWPKKAVQNG